MSKRYVPANGAAIVVPEDTGVITLNAAALGVQDMRDYFWVVQLEGGGASAISVDARGPRGLVEHTAAAVDNQILFISESSAEFYSEVIITLVGSTLAKAHVWGEERGR